MGSGLFINRGEGFKKIKLGLAFSPFLKQLKMEPTIEQAEIETRYSESYNETVQRHINQRSIFYIDVCIYPALNQMWFYACHVRTSDSNSIATWKVTPKQKPQN